MADISKVTIEEQAGKRRTLGLLGSALPRRGAPWGVEQRMVTDAVPGNADDAIQQVLGPIDTPSTWEGIWRTTRLAARPAYYQENGGSPQKIALAFTLWEIVDDMTRAGQLCRVVWSVGTKKVERLGRISVFTPQPELITDIEWSLEWQWIGRGPARQSVAKFRSDSKAALAKSVQLELGKLTAEIEAAKVVSSKQNLPGTADSFSLGDLEAFLDAPKELMAGLARTAQQLASRIDAVGKLIEKAERLPADLATQAVNAATAVVQACAEFDQRVSVSGPEVYTTFDQSSSVQNLLRASSYFGDAQSRAETAMQLAAELRLAARKAAKQGPGQEGPAGAAMPVVLAVVIAKAGDTFSGIAARYYDGNADYGPAIAKANRYSAYAIAPPPGAVLVIPNASIAKDTAA